MNDTNLLVTTNLIGTIVKWVLIDSTKKYSSLSEAYTRRRWEVSKKGQQRNSFTLGKRKLFNSKPCKIYA